MPRTETDLAPQLIDDIDAALAKHPNLTDQQFDHVRRLRTEIRSLCRSGNLEEARKGHRLARFSHHSVVEVARGGEFFGR